MAAPTQIKSQPRPLRRLQTTPNIQTTNIDQLAQEEPHRPYSETEDQQRISQPRPLRRAKTTPNIQTPNIDQLAQEEPPPPYSETEDQQRISQSPLKNARSRVKEFMNELPQNYQMLTNENQFMNTFMFIYLLYAVFACLLVIAVAVLIAFDYGKFTFYEIYQKLSIISNPNVFNKDTMDFESLHYAKDKADGEPYTFHSQQTVVANIFILISVVIFTFFIQFFLFAVLKSIAISGHLKFTEQLFPTSGGTIYFKAIVILLIVAVLAITLKGYYNASFVKKLQPSISALSKNIDHISDRIYANISTDETFLKYVLDENMTECIKYINKQDGKYENAGSMIFTMSLYNYFKVNVTSNSSVFNDIRKIFTLNGIRTRDIKPLNYMYFNQNIFISDQYPILEEYISGEGKLLDTTEKQKRVRTNVATRVRHINTLFTALFTLSINRTNLKWYIIFEVIIIAFFVFIIALIIFPKEVGAYVWTNINIFNVKRTERPTFL